MADDNSVTADARAQRRAALSLLTFRESYIPEEMPRILAGVTLAAPPRTLNPVTLGSRYLGLQREDAFTEERVVRWVEGISNFLSSHHRPNIHNISDLLFNDGRLVAAVNPVSVDTANAERSSRIPAHRREQHFLFERAELDSIRNILEDMGINDFLQELENESRVQTGPKDRNRSAQYQRDVQGVIAYATCLAFCQHHRARDVAMQTAREQVSSTVSWIHPDITIEPEQRVATQHALRDSASLQRDVIHQLAGIVNTLREPDPLKAMLTPAQDRALGEVLTMLINSSDPERIRYAKLAANSANFLAGHSPFRDIRADDPGEGDARIPRTPASIIERARIEAEGMVAEVSMHILGQLDTIDAERAGDFLQDLMQRDLYGGISALRTLVDEHNRLRQRQEASKTTNPVYFELARGRQAIMVKALAEALSELAGIDSQTALERVLSVTVGETHRGNRKQDIAEATEALRHPNRNPKENKATPFRIEGGSQEELTQQANAGAAGIITDALPAILAAFPDAVRTTIVPELEHHLANYQGMPDLQIHAIREAVQSARIALAIAQEQKTSNSPSSAGSSPAQEGGGPAQAPRRPGGRTGR